MRTRNISCIQITKYKCFSLLYLCLYAGTQTGTSAGETSSFLTGRSASRFGRLWRLARGPGRPSSWLGKIWRLARESGGQSEHLGGKSECIEANKRVWEVSLRVWWLARRPASLRVWKPDRSPGSSALGSGGQPEGVGGHSEHLKASKRASR